MKKMGQTDTVQFKRWFGKSRVVNEDGSPKVMYHGTATEFWTFDKRKANDKTGRMMGLGAGKGKFYLTEHKESANAAAYSAQSTGRGNAPRVMELYVSAQKVMDRAEYNRRLQEAYGRYSNSDPRGDNYDYKARDKAVAAVDNALRKEGYDGVWDRESGEMFVYEPTQIKSATDNVGTFEPDNPDIRYSLKDVDTQNDEMTRLLEENEEMRKLARKLGDLINRDPGTYQVKKRIVEMAKRFKEETGTRIPQSTLVYNLDKAFTAMAQAESEGESKAAMEMLGSIAEDMLKKSSMTNTVMYDQYEEMREYLHNGIRLTEGQWREVKSRYGGNREFRRAIAGLGLKIQPEDSKGQTLDNVWDELCGMWPEFFKPDTTEGDQVEAVVAAMEAVQPVYENPDGLNLDQYAANLALRMSEEYAHLPEEGRADKLGRLTEQAELSGEISRLRKKITQKQQDVNEAGQLEARVKAYRKIALGLTEAERRRLDTYKKADSVQKMKGQIIRQRNQLMNRLMHPGNGTFVPDKMQEGVIALLECIDFEGKITGVKTKTLSAQKLTQAKDIYMNMDKEEAPNSGMRRNGENFRAYVNEELAGDFDLLISEADGMEARLLNEKQMQALRNIVAGFWAAVDNADRNFMDERKTTLKESGDMMMMQLSGRKERLVQGGFMEKVSNVISKGMLKPETIMHMLDGTELGKAMRILRAAEDKHITQVTAAEKFLNRKIEQYGMQESLRTEDSKDKRKKEKAIRLSAVDDSGPRVIRLTDQERMSVYAIWKREQIVGTNHLLGGGITLKNAPKGTSREAVRLTRADIEAIIATLTNEQKAYVDEMVGYLSRECAEWGNEVTRKLYGVEKFREDYYIPFESDEKYTRIQYGQQQDKRLKMGSFTKALTEKASTAIKLTPFTELWCGHVEAMSDFAAFVLPIEDVTRLLNYRQDGVTVRAMLERKYGSQLTEWIRIFMEKLNGNARMEDGGNLINSIVGKAKGAAVTANLSVAIQQFGSAPRAMAEIDAKYFMPAGPKAFGGKGSVLASYEECQKYAPIAILKDWGYFDTNMTRGLYQRAQNKRMDRLNEMGGSLAALGDKTTWAWIWEAVKLETADKRKDLTKGSEAYFAACAKRFTEVIDRTQVVDSIFQRAQYATENGMMRTLTAFQSEPFAMYNMLYRCVWDIRNSTDPAQKKRAKDKLYRTTAWIVVSSALTAALKGFPAAARDRDNEKKDEEGNIVGVRDYWDKYRESFGGSMLDNILGIGNIVTSAVQAGRSYMNSDMTMQIIGYIDDVFGELSTLFDMDSKTNPDWEKVTYRATQILSSATGTGFASAYRDLRSMGMTAYEYIARDSLAGAAWDKSLPFATRVAAAEKNYVMKKQGDNRKVNSDIYYDLMLTAYFDSGFGDDFATAVEAAIRTGGGEGIVDSFKTKLRVAEERVPKAAQALMDGDMKEYSRLRDELNESAIGERAVASMINNAYNAMQEKEEKEPPTSASIIEELERDDVATDPQEMVASSAYSAAVEAGSPTQLKQAVAELKKIGMDDETLYKKVRTSFRKDYCWAVWTGDRSTAQKAAEMMKGAGVGIDNADLKTWTSAMNDYAIDEMYRLMREGDGKKAHIIHKYLVEANSSADMDKKLKSWAKKYIKGEKDEANVRAALKQMGYSQATIDGWFK